MEDSISRLDFVSIAESVLASPVRQPVMRAPRGVADGGGGGGSRGSGHPHFWKPQGLTPVEIWTFQYFFLKTYKHFVFSNIFKIKWPKSEEKLNFGGRWVWVSNVYESDPPINISWRRPWTVGHPIYHVPISSVWCFKCAFFCTCSLRAEDRTPTKLWHY